MTKQANFGLVAVAVVVVLVGAGSVRADLTDGLVAHWKLDGDAIDSAGGNNGTIHGAIPTTGKIPITMPILTKAEIKKVKLRLPASIRV